MQVKLNVDDDAGAVVEMQVDSEVLLDAPAGRTPDSMSRAIHAACITTPISFKSPPTRYVIGMLHVASDRNTTDENGEFILQCLGRLGSDCAKKDHQIASI